MLPLPPSLPASLWHHSLVVDGLLANVGVCDVRLTLVWGIPGPDRLEWRPDSDRGAALFAALDSLRHQAVGTAFVMAGNDCARADALAAAQYAPTVPSVVATRFGDPERWLGFGSIEATRRFRANWENRL